MAAAAKPTRSTQQQQQQQQPAVSNRRVALGGAAALTLAPALGALPLPALAEGGVPTVEFMEPMLAYKFAYPSTDNTGAVLKWFTSRKPERYSSAAPMSADARQRIVYEVVDFTEPLIISVSVGPIPPSLVGKPVSEWKPEKVADAILIDKSTARVTTGQRVALSIIENAEKVEKGGEPYWLYEHVSQGSPTLNEVLQKETYRHSYAVTAKRGDYMYTLNLACPERRWDTVEALFKTAQESFTLVTPGKDFVPPESQPWRFW